MSANEEIARLREVLRRVAYDLALAEIALGYVEKEQARPTPTWQGLTDAERSEHIIKFCGGVLTTPKLYALLEKVEQQLKAKNGGTR
jgi:hypothetical protein